MTERVGTRLNYDLWYASSPPGGTKSHTLEETNCWTVPQRMEHIRHESVNTVTLITIKYGRLNLCSKTLLAHSFLPPSYWEKLFHVSKQNRIWDGLNCLPNLTWQCSQTARIGPAGISSDGIKEETDQSLWKNGTPSCHTDSWDRNIRSHLLLEAQQGFASQ